MYAKICSSSYIVLQRFNLLWSVTVHVNRQKEHFAPSNPPILLNNKSKMNMKAIFELRLNTS